METSLTKVCRHCKAVFNKLPRTNYKQWSRQFCCSTECGNKSKKTPWLVKHQIKKGEHLGSETQFRKGENTGATNNRWKGEDASYTAKHLWASSRFGKPQFCEHCKTSSRRMYHWANLSGEHKRDRDDWIRLCVSCHKKMDISR